MTRQQFELGNSRQDTSPSSTFKTRLPQILANVAANLLVLDLCMAIAFTTVLIGATLDAEGDISIDENQASWLGSIAFICQPIGSLMSSFIVEFFGRKWSMFLVNIPFLAGWLVYSFSASISMLFAANIILGLGIGFMEAPIMTYLSETCQPQLRALITSFPAITCQISVFVVFFMGTITDWRSAAGINAALPIFTALYVLLMPETPIWLLSRGRYMDAEKSLCWLRGWVTPDVVREEFNQLVLYSNKVNKTNFPVTTVGATVTRTQNVGVASTNGGYENRGFEPDAAANGVVEPRSTAVLDYQDEMLDEDGGAHCSLQRWKEVLKPQTLRPLTIVNPCFFLLHWGGLSSIKPYLLHVFQKFGLGDAASWTTVGSGVSSVCGGAALVALVHWVGKKKLSLVALAGSAACCFVVAVYSYVILGPGGATTEAMPWIPLTMIILMAFFNSLFFYIPWNWLSEMFPFRTRGIASGFSAAMCYVFLFAASKVYLEMEDSLQLYGSFLIFTAINVLGFVFVCWKVPNTEGKSLFQIEQYFTGQRR